MQRFIILFLKDNLLLILLLLISAQASGFENCQTSPDETFAQTKTRLSQKLLNAGLRYAREHSHPVTGFVEDTVTNYSDQEAPVHARASISSTGFMIDWSTGDRWIDPKTHSGVEYATTDSTWFLAGGIVCAEVFPHTEISKNFAKIFSAVNFKDFMTDGNQMALSVANLNSKNSVWDSFIKYRAVQRGLAAAAQAPRPSTGCLIPED